MLVRLSATSRISQDWDIQDEIAPNPAFLKECDEKTLFVDLLSLTLPRPDQTLQCVLDRCSKTVKSLQSSISGHLDSVAEVLYQLEGEYKMGDLEESDDPSLSAHDITASNPAQLKEPDIRMTPPELPVDSSESSIPTIVITPCERERISVPSRIPLQNAAFGNQLTVPGYPSFNRAHPPQLAPPSVLSGIKGWTWNHGHWEADIFSLQEQEQRGLYSRMTAKRRTSHGRNFRAIRARSSQQL